MPKMAINGVNEPTYPLFPLDFRSKIIGFIMMEFGHTDHPETNIVLLDKK